jgi:hypothetical protein
MTLFLLRAIGSSLFQHFPQINFVESTINYPLEQMLRKFPFPFPLFLPLSPLSPSAGRLRLDH